VFAAISSGRKYGTESTAHPAISTPAPPPISASTKLSVRNSRKSCQRLAPAAMRIAISFWRLAALASRRLPTFAATINCTPKLTASSSRSAGPIKV